MEEAVMARPVFAGIDPNRVTPEELVSISGIGPETARAIVRYREQHGPIRSWKDLEHLLDEVSLVPSDETNASAVDAAQQSGPTDAAEAEVTIGSAR